MFRHLLELIPLQQTTDRIKTVFSFERTLKSRPFHIFPNESADYSHLFSELIAFMATGNREDFKPMGFENSYYHQEELKRLDKWVCR